MGGKYDKPFSVGCRVPDTQGPRANATLLALSRNSDIDGLIASVRSMEDHFNKWFHYPWTFLNDKPFSEEFMNRIRQETESVCEFGVIPADHWEFPQNINDHWINDALQFQADRNVTYGDQKSYHQMCRFFSGFFFRHPLVKKYKWYWRVEPDVEYFCDTTYDVFVEMEHNGKWYGFNAFIREIKSTVENLFRVTQAFRKQWDVPETDLWKTVALSTGKAAKDKDPSYGEPMANEVFNMCHFWSNFEIARVDLWNSPLYLQYFEALEEAGGFWFERWGDAPVHTLAVAMMLNASQIHYFRDIGYAHSTLGLCPGNAPTKQIDLVYDSTLGQPDTESINGVGCRCRCSNHLDKFRLEYHGCLLENLLPVLGGEIPRLNQY